MNSELEHNFSFFFCSDYMLFRNDDNLLITWVYDMFKDTRKGMKFHMNFWAESFKGQW